MKPIHKFNNGIGAMLCNNCRTIISTGPATKELFCEKCKREKENSPIMEFDRFPVSGDPGVAIPVKDDNGSIVDWKLFDSDDEVKAYYEQMEKEVHQNRSNLNE